jgi:hypothetical protein
MLICIVALILGAILLLNLTSSKPVINVPVLISYPESVRRCWNPQLENKIDYYLVAATMLKNKRQYIREWIEFHLMMGVSYFFFYDHHSDDGVEAVLRPYVEAGRVSYFLWPPKEYPKEEWNDNLMEDHFDERMKKCYANREAEHVHVPCQEAAYDDAIRRSRGKVRWFTGIDIDEFFYIPENSTIWKTNPNDPLVGAFKKLEKYNLVTVSGQHFGTSGWFSPPRRDDDSAHAQLITKTHLHHMQYIPGELVKASEHIKPFINPYCVIGNELHDYTIDKANIKNISWKYTYHNTYDEDNSTVLMNHILWPSYMENIEKAIVNGNPKTAYDAMYDRFVNKEEGSAIEYLLDKLEQRMQASIKTKPPTDGHADDWDYRLRPRHVFNPAITEDLCVVIWEPRHIGLVRHALSSIINYFYRVENGINYKLIIYDTIQSIKTELENDFPIDLFLQDEVDLKKSCSSQFILRISESSFAKWEQWPLEKPAIKLGLALLNENKNVQALSLSDSSNSISEWTESSNVNYRKNSALKNSGTFLIRQNAVIDENIYELCLHVDDLCPDNKIRSIFENYRQERMYGFKPGFVKS